MTAVPFSLLMVVSYDFHLLGLQSPGVLIGCWGPSKPVVFCLLFIFVTEQLCDAQTLSRATVTGPQQRCPEGQPLSLSLRQLNTPRTILHNLSSLAQAGF